MHVVVKRMEPTGVACWGVHSLRDSLPALLLHTGTSDEVEAARAALVLWTQLRAWGALGGCSGWCWPWHSWAVASRFVVFLCTQVFTRALWVYCWARVGVYGDSVGWRSASVSNPSTPESHRYAPVMCSFWPVSEQEVNSEQREEWILLCTIVRQPASWAVG